MKKLLLILCMMLFTSPVLAYNDKVKVGDEFISIVGASWCPPCRQLDQLLKDPDVVKALKHYAYVFHIDGDRDIKYRRYYRVDAYPTVIKFRKTGKKKYQELSRFVGLKSKKWLIKWLNTHSIVK